MDARMGGGSVAGGIEVSPGYDDMIPGGSGEWTPPDLNK